MTHSLEGIWQPTYAELGGEEAPRMMLEKMEIELIHGRYTVRFGGEIYDQGHYTVDTASHVTLLGTQGPNAGRTIPGLFKAAGDALSICYGLAGLRPEKFATGTDPQLYLVNYTRKS